MASLLQNVLAQFVRPEEHALGAELKAAYAANRASIVAALEAKGVTALALLQKEADAFVPTVFAQIPEAAVLGPLLEPVAISAVNSLIAKVVASAPSSAAIVGAWLDAAVAEVVATLEAA